MRRHDLSTRAAVGFIFMAAGLLAYGCFDLDDYTLVPGSPPGTGGFGASGGIGNGGTGGFPEECETGDAGIVYAAMVRGSTNAGEGPPGCEAPTDLDPGLDVLALSPVDGECIASARILTVGGATIDAASRAFHALDDRVYVAGSFAGGSLELPELCDGGNTVLAEEPAGATDNVFVAALEPSGNRFCTRWVQVASTDDAGGALSIDSIAPASNGIAVGGRLAANVIAFDDAGSAVEVGPGAFFARFAQNGELLDAVAFGGADRDAATSLSALSQGFLVSGTLLGEDPDCYDCVGASEVEDAVGSCPDVVGGAGGGGGAGGSGGAGGMGGMGGTGGVGGMGGMGGAGGAPDPGEDRYNAFTWQRQDGEAVCVRLSTFGVDRGSEDDAQVGYGISAVDNLSGCTTYWTGLAGRESWRFDSSDPASALFDTGGASHDAFLAKLVGPTGASCVSGADVEWSLRLSPFPVGPVVWGSRVEAKRCGTGVSMSALIDDASGGTLNVHRCDTDGDCVANADQVELLDTDGEGMLLVASLDSDGQIVWSARLGPLAPSSQATTTGAPLGRRANHLARGPDDDVTVLVTTNGPMLTSNIEAFGCSDAIEGSAPAGTYMIHLRAEGFIDRAHCEWITRIDR